jgi:hypothetical protein
METAGFKLYIPPVMIPGLHYKEGFRIPCEKEAGCCVGDAPPFFYM